jgi:hypothetical protein
LGWQTNICTPELSIPTDLLNYYPGWSTCVAQFDGVFDPPIALQTADGLFTTPSQPQGQSLPPTSSATPGNTPTPPGPTPTPTPTPTAIQQTQQQSSPSPVSNGGSGPVSVSQTQQQASPSPIFNGGSSPVPNTIAVASSQNGGLPSVFIPSSRPNSPAIIVNGQTVSTDTAGHFVIGTQTATTDAGGNIVFGTQTIAANSQGNFVIGTETASINSQGNIVIGGQTITPNTQGNFVITGAATITEGNGQVVTVTGATVSVGTSTGIGGFIASIIGITPTKTSTASESAPPQYTGAAPTLKVGLLEESLIVGGLLWLMAWL